MLTTLYYAALIVAALIVLVCLHLWGPLVREWWTRRRRRRAAFARLMTETRYLATYTGPDFEGLQYGATGWVEPAPGQPGYVRFFPHAPKRYAYQIPVAEVAKVRP